jgi:hypothetical protein
VQPLGRDGAAGRSETGIITQADDAMLQGHLDMVQCGHQRGTALPGGLESGRIGSSATAVHPETDGRRCAWTGVSMTLPRLKSPQSVSACR